MLYAAYQAQTDLISPARAMAQAALSALGMPAMAGLALDFRASAAAFEMMTRSRLTP